MNTKIVTILAILLLAFSTIAGAQDFQPALQSRLNETAGYEYGGSRLALTELDSLMHQVYNDPVLRGQAEKAFIQFLKSDATLASKQFISSKLSLIGTEASVSVLSKMIREPETFDMALFALERIPAAKAGNVLRGCLKKTAGNSRIGIINALGNRGDIKAVTKLKPLVLDADEATALAAIAAIGRIADEKAAGILVSLVNETSGQRKLAVYDAYLQYADALIKRGNTFEAGEIYKKMTGRDYPETVRQSALTGWITSSQTPGRICLDILKTGDAVLQSAAIYHIGRIRRLDLADQMAETLPLLGSMQQVQLITALAERGEYSAADAVMRAARSGDADVRVAALKALEFLGDASSVQLLAGASTGTGDEADAARESLDRVKGADMDAVFTRLLAGSNPEVQSELLRSIGTRQMADLSPVVYSLAESGAPKVRQQAMRTLGIIYDPAKLGDLVALLTKSEDGPERAEAENMIVAAAGRTGEGSHPSEALLSALPDVKAVNVKSSMLQVMGRLGDEAALPEIKKAVSGRDREMSKAGIRALSAWPNAAPIDELMAQAQSSKDKTSQVLALRGFIRLIGLDEGDAEKKIVCYRKALGLAGETNEKRLVLAGVSSVRSPLALAMAGELIEDKSVSPEAEAAVVRIAGQIWRQYPQETLLILKNIAGNITDDERKTAVETIMQRIEGL